MSEKRSFNEEKLHEAEIIYFVYCIFLEGFLGKGMTLWAVKHDLWKVELFLSGARGKPL